MDYLNQKAQFLNCLQPAATTVIQSFVFNYKTKKFFSTQVFSQQPAESFILSRMDYSGNLLDSMIVKNGGHGTTFGVETDSAGITWIWSNLNSVDAAGTITGRKLIRFQYIPTDDLVEPDYQEYDRFSGHYTTPVIDQVHGLIALKKIVDDDTLVQEIELRKLEDVKNGINDLLGKVTIVPTDEDSKVMQGLTIDNYDCYWYTGPSTGKARLAHYDFRTGALIKEKEVNFGKEPEGIFLDGYREPEGLHVYRDPSENITMLMAGVVVGGVGRRKAKIYGFMETDSWDRFFRLRFENYVTREYYRDTRRDKRVPLNIDKLTSIRQSGRYYMTTSDANRFIDHPEPNSSGWFMDILGGNGLHTYQVLSRNSVGRPVTQYFRVVNDRGEAYAWQKVVTVDS